MCGALTYAECGARLPHDGGFYVFYREAYGQGLAFVAGIIGALVTYPASLAVIALVLAPYFTELVPATRGHENLVATLALALACALNIIGVRAEAIAQRILTTAKLLSITAVCVAAAFAFSSEATKLPPPPTSHSSNEADNIIGIQGLLGALVAVLWTYSGWSDVTLVAGELRNPSRNLSRTVIWGTGILVLLYGGVQFAVHLTLGSAAASSTRVLSDAAAMGLGPTGGTWISLLVVLSTFGAIHGTLLAASRLGYPMAADGIFPRWLANPHPKLGTPVCALISLFVLALLYVNASSFRDLLGLFTFSIWIFYALAAVALLRFRHLGIGSHQKWHAPGGMLPPLVVIVTALWMSGSLLADAQQRKLALGGIGIFLGAALLFGVRRIWPSKNRGFGATDADS